MADNDEHTNFKFGTAINCIDGKMQQAVIDPLKPNYGVDGVFSRENPEIIAQLKSSVAISVEKH